MNLNIDNLFKFYRKHIPQSTIESFGEPFFLYNMELQNKLYNLQDWKITFDRIGSRLNLFDLVK